jgi:hypothetical protein
MRNQLGQRHADRSLENRKLASDTAYRDPHEFRAQNEFSQGAIRNFEQEFPSTLLLRPVLDISRRAETWFFYPMSDVTAQSVCTWQRLSRYHDFNRLSTVIGEKNWTSKIAVTFDSKIYLALRTSCMSKTCVKRIFADHAWFGKYRVFRKREQISNKK